MADQMITPYRGLVGVCFSVAGMFVYIYLCLLQSQLADNVCSRDAIKEQIEFSLAPMGDLAPSVHLCLDRATCPFGVDKPTEACRKEIFAQ